MEFRYETHLHTSEASACGKSRGDEYVVPYKKLGYAGIIVTDHFFNGNTAIPGDLPWEERVDRFRLGYERAREAGEREGLSVFFGFEVNFTHDEYLIYGPDKFWLYEHPDILSWSRRQLFERVDAAGGCMVHAYPFRVREYVPEIRLYPHTVHAVEAGNGGNGPGADESALRYAREFGLPATSGSDIHDASNVDRVTRGVAFEKPVRSIREFADAIRSGRGYRPLGLPRIENGYADEECRGLAVNLYDYEGNLVKSRPAPDWPRSAARSASPNAPAI